MSDGFGFSTISGTFLEKVVGNERLSRDLPRRGRDARHEAMHGNAAERPHPEDDAARCEEDPKPAHIDLRI